MVARATGNLCEAANQAVQGEASEEKLVTSAKQVASSTAQLLVACKVKADPNSENMKRLQVMAFNKQLILLNPLSCSLLRRKLLFNISLNYTKGCWYCC